MEKEKQDKPAFRVGVNVFVVRDGKLLLGKRKNTFGAGFWGLPGGHLEWHEDMAAAAARELLEETGLSALEFQFVNLINNCRRPDDDHLIHVGFLAKGVKGEPKVLEPDKCEEWRWFDLKKLPGDLFFGHAPQTQAFIDNKIFVDA